MPVPAFAADVVATASNDLRSLEIQVQRIKNDFISSIGAGGTTDMGHSNGMLRGLVVGAASTAGGIIGAALTAEMIPVMLAAIEEFIDQLVQG